MPVDYSKWDALELSDDSDIEVHPNVDKKSFIRAKQNQIHQERYNRKQEIETLKYEKQVNDGLLERIDRLLGSLNRHLSNGVASNEKADEAVFSALFDASGDPLNDQPPTRPEAIRSQMQEQPTYSKMMASLVDQVKQAIDKQKPDHRLHAYVKEVGVHQAKVQDLQRQLLIRLADLEKQEKLKITSDSIHDGFNSSHVSKAAAVAATSYAPTKSSSSSVELLNPPSGADFVAPATSGSEADEEDESTSESSIQPSALGKAFARLPRGDYRAYLDYISQNPAVLAERETDGLLMQAFNEESAGNADGARQCVHQALLLQYCRSLGRDGVALFFKRITTEGHQAKKVFFDDVNTTYARLRDRSKEISKQGGFADDDEEAGVEQIQLHAVNPGQKIHIGVPSATDAGEADSRAIFESFSPGLRRALETGELDEVNKVLGKMSVDEAEQIVEQLSAGGMLSLEEGVIDATTEEGKKHVEEIERQARLEREANGNDNGMADAAEAKLSVDEVD